LILQVFKLRGESLSPDFQDGDFVVACGLPIFLHRLRAGDVVVFERPPYGRLVKRVERLEACGRLFVVGPAPGSVDSYTFGPIHIRDVQGVVVWHIKQ
jgi:hypothetical protein